MSIFSSIRMWLASHASLRRRYRYPALAEANKALIAVEEEVVEFNEINRQMDLFRQAQVLPEKDRDLAYIPIYLAIENFVATHRPPIVRQVLTTEELRAKVRQKLNLEMMNESFRLIFLPDNQQADHLLKVGALELLRFLSTSLGRSQLEFLIAEAVGDTALGSIEVTDDGVSFEKAHEQLQKLPKPEVVALYTKLYHSIFNEIKSLFGEKETLDLVETSRNLVKERYNTEFLALYDSVLPDTARR